MSNINLKKWIIPNLPYLLFVYLFDKVAQAIRLTPGLDASQKLLHLGEGFTAAFLLGYVCTVPHSSLNNS